MRAVFIVAVHIFNGAGPILVSKTLKEYEEIFGRIWFVRMRGSRGPGAEL